ncbi:DUF222 domain-containing protein [Egibacter rhizosphaerae]|uniref:DUF222 domain-containing protein n=1 Tax=Egibacter rhizosphaerae TaxID=1670831 RepID=A0A411YJG1_9ACTN|nr:DUF222 domain-containing protein [Egibacter rhizosphaerae]QBI21226.1 DUF222 domain-containing protein [Egibacter rhizosphaerae]
MSSESAAGAGSPGGGTNRGREASSAELLAVVEDALQQLQAMPLSAAESDEALLRSVERLVRCERMAAAERLRRLGAIDERQAHRTEGTSSAARWLAERVAITRSEAQKQLRTASRLEHLPGVAASFANGEVSEDHVHYAARTYDEMAQRVARGEDELELFGSGGTSDEPSGGQPAAGDGDRSTGGNGSSTPEDGDQKDGDDGRAGGEDGDASADAGSGEAGSRDAGSGETGSGGDSAPATPDTDPNHDGAPGPGGTGPDGGDRSGNGDAGSGTDGSGGSRDGQDADSGSRDADDRARDGLPDHVARRLDAQRRLGEALDRHAQRAAEGTDRAAFRRALDDWRREHDPEFLARKERRAFARRRFWIANEQDEDGLVAFGGKAEPHGLAYLRAAIDALSRPGQTAGGIEDGGEAPASPGSTDTGNASSGTGATAGNGTTSEPGATGSEDTTGTDGATERTRNGGRRDRASRQQRQYDALVTLARLALQADEPPRQTQASAHVLLVTNPEALHGHADAEPSWLDGVGAVSSETARLICCDARFSAVTERNGEVLDAGRSRRDPSQRQVDAVVARDRACVGCGTRVALCQVHHAQWWRRDQGRTDVDNLCLLCWECHWHVHHHGWTVARKPDGRFVVHRPFRSRPADPTADSDAGSGTARRRPSHTPTDYTTVPPAPESRQPSDHSQPSNGYGRRHRTIPREPSEAWDLAVGRSPPT